MDRLSTLISRFRMRLDIVPIGSANFVVHRPAGEAASRLLFLPQGGRIPAVADMSLVARVAWDGGLNPLVTALPERIDLALADCPQVDAVIGLILQELSAHRCGAETVVAGLGQAMIVRLLRHLIERGTASPGMLSGLADQRLARAIVAMHDHPGRLWTTQDLAGEAGLSLSRFSELFAAQVGETPMGYLRRWRLTLASQDLRQGARVEAVARRYGYDSPEGFTRAFRKAFGVAPISLRMVEA